MFMTSDSVPFKIVGWLMASQQKHRELLDFAKPIKILEFIDVETNRLSNALLQIFFRIKMTVMERQTDSNLNCLLL